MVVVILSIVKDILFSSCLVPKVTIGGLCLLCDDAMLPVPTGGDVLVEFGAIFSQKRVADMDNMNKQVHCWCVDLGRHEQARTLA